MAGTGVTRPLLLLLLCAVLALLRCASAAVHRHRGAFFQAGDAWLFRGGREGLFASSSDAVLHWATVGKGIANGKAYIRFDQVRFTRSADEAGTKDVNAPDTGLVQALLFDVKDRNQIGYVTPGRGRHFCCSPELVSKTGCSPGKLIVKPTAGDNQWPRVIDIHFTGNETTSPPLSVEIPITKSGMYYMWFLVCDKTLSDLTASGSTIWKNPAGYLPGMMTPFLNFYGFMSLMYLLLGAVWFLQYTRFWQETFQLQYCIAAVLVLSMLEMAVWYFDYVNFNATGFRPYGITLWAVFFSAVRKTVSRVLLLIVSMGFGVVRPTLGGLSNKVLLLGGAYFLSVLALSVMQDVGAINDMNSAERVLLVLPVAVLDAIFILWIFNSLSKTVSHLQTKKNSHKLDLYSKFTYALAGGVVASVTWIAYEMYTRFSDPYNQDWENDWVNYAFWHVLNLFLVSLICFLWAPSQSATRYAFQEGDDTNEEQVALTATTVGKQTGEEKKPVNTDVFSLEDDPEEGKLE